MTLGLVGQGARVGAPGGLGPGWHDVSLAEISSCPALGM